MKSIAFIIDSILRVKRVSQAEIAEKAGIHRSNLSRFLSGEVDIRLTSLISILNSLDIHLDKFLENELQKQLAQGDKNSIQLAQSLELIAMKANPISLRSALETVIASLPKDDSELETAINVARRSIPIQTSPLSPSNVSNAIVANLVGNKVL